VSLGKKELSVGYSECTSSEDRGALQQYVRRESNLEQPSELSASLQSLFYQRNFFVSPKEHLCFTKGTSLFHQRNIFVLPKEHLCLTKGTSLFYKRNFFVSPKEHLCFTKGTALFHQRNIFVLPKEPLCFTKGTSLFYQRKEKLLLASARTETGYNLGVTVSAAGVGEDSFQLEQLQ
jgi:hypothetical protein